LEKCYIDYCRDKHHSQALCRYHYDEQLRYNKRQLVFEILNQYECINCGFADERALQFDHINGDGKKHPPGGLTRVLFFLKNPEYTRNNIQILCANCNWIKRHKNREYAKNARG